LNESFLENGLFFRRKKLYSFIDVGPLNPETVPSSSFNIFLKFNNINCDFVSDSGSYFITPHVSQLKAAVFPLLEVKNIAFMANLLKFVVIKLLSPVLLLRLSRAVIMSSC
jgi:hypothetical protein